MEQVNTTIANTTITGQEPDECEPSERVDTGVSDTRLGARHAGSSPASPPVSSPASLSGRLRSILDAWAQTHHELVTTAAEFADGREWFLDGAPTPAAWLASAADVEACTAREWIRIGRCLQALPAIADAFKRNTVSYTKVRTLTRLATPHNEAELLAIAEVTPAGDLGRALAAWLNRNAEPEDIDRMQHQARSVKWRTEPDGMVSFSLRLQPVIAAFLIAFLTTWVMRSRPRPRHDEPWPTAAQQYADAVADLVQAGRPTIDSEVVFHVRGDDDFTLADGTPITATALSTVIDDAFISAVIHDADGDPIDATNRRRHPNRRQRRLVDERDPVCVDCGRGDLLECDHVPAFEQTGHTVTGEIKRRCAPCHHNRHRQAV